MNIPQSLQERRVKDRPLITLNEDEAVNGVSNLPVLPLAGCQNASPHSTLYSLSLANVCTPYNTLHPLCPARPASVVWMEVLT